MNEQHLLNNPDDDKQIKSIVMTKSGKNLIFATQNNEVYIQPIQNENEWLTLGARKLIVKKIPCIDSKSFKLKVSSDEQYLLVQKEDFEWRVFDL